MRGYEIVIAIVLILIAGGIYNIAFHLPIEYFTSYNEDDVVSVYKTLLDRDPSPTELINHTKSLEKGTTTVDVLKQRIVDSDEYDRILKTQSNDINPMLHKLIVDRTVIETLALIYKKKRGSDINPRVSLPLKDLYGYLNYNLHVFEAVLHAPQYSLFETDLLNATFLNRDKMLDLFNTHYESLAGSNPLGLPIPAKINGLPPFVNNSATLNAVGQSTYQNVNTPGGLDKSMYQPVSYDITTPPDYTAGPLKTPQDFVNRVTGATGAQTITDPFAKTTQQTIQPIIMPTTNITISAT